MNPSKYSMFLTMLYFPICTVSLVEEIYKYLNKIWDGCNPVYKTDFRSVDHSQDYERYFNEDLGGLDFWKIKGSEKMKSNINSVMIVDMKTEQSTPRPEPYMYFLPFGAVVDYDLKDSECFEWIMYQSDKGQLVVLDDLKYRVYDFKEGIRNEINPIPVVENSHDLGYCPARFFWTSPINGNTPEVKKSPITTQLGQLDNVVYYEVSNEHLNSYARFPIFSLYAVNCKYESENGEVCDGGFLRNADDLYIVQGNGLMKNCPICEQKSLVGAGSKITVSPPSKANDNADLSKPVNIIGAEVETLDYNNKDIASRKSEIFKAITGFYGNAPNDKAVNEMQVRSMMESLEIALQEPQLNFEMAIKWVTDTICLLRYGSGSYIGCSVSLGTEHFILTSDQFLKMYKEAIDTKSFSFSALDYLEDRYFETEYRNNKEQLQRQKVLTNLDPFRHRTIDEVSKLHEEGSIKFEDYFIKMNLSSLISRFERENIALTEYGANSDFNVKIESIYSELVEYAKEAKPAGLTGGVSLDKQLELYALGVRSGGVTPQTIDEEFFREKLQISGMSKEAIEAWHKDKGVRRPVTLKGQSQLNADLETTE